MANDILLRDVAPEDREALAAAAKRNNQSVQRYLADLVHEAAMRERARAALERTERRLAEQGGAGMTTEEILAERDAARAAHSAHLAERTGLQL